MHLMSCNCGAGHQSNEVIYIQYGSGLIFPPFLLRFMMAGVGQNKMISVLDKSVKFCLLRGEIYN